MKKILLFFLISLSSSTFAAPIDILWTDFFLISSSSGDHSYPVTAMNDKGQAVTIWATDSGDVQAVHSTDGGITWSTPITISNITQFFPTDSHGYGVLDLDINESGTAVAIWWSSSDNLTVNLIQESHSPDGGITWSSPNVLDYKNGATFYNFYVSYPKIVINDAGVITATWLSRDISDSYQTLVEAHSLDSGTNWDTSILQSIVHIEMFHPRIAINNKNHSIITWEYDYDANNYIISESHSQDAGQNWSSPNVLDSTDFNEYSTVAINDNDQAIIVWTNTDYITYGVIKEVHSIDGGMNFSSPTSSNQLLNFLYDLNIGMNNSGEAIVSSYYSDDNGIYEWHTSDGGLNWSTLNKISSSPAEDLPTKIAMNSSGEAIVFWFGNTDIFENHTFDAGQSWYGETDFGPYYNIAIPCLSLSINNHGQSNIVAINSTSLDIYESHPRLLNTFFQQTSADSLLQRDIIDIFKWGNISDAILYDIYKIRNYHDLLYAGTNLYFYRHSLMDIKYTYFLNWYDGSVNSFPYTINPIN